MKVLQVNGYESPGSRFHGLSVTPQLRAHGIESSHLVWHKDTQNPEVLTFKGLGIKKLNRLLTRIERAKSLQSMLYPHAMQMMKMPAFKAADLVHLHIIHSGYFSLRHLAKVTEAKPTVWTLHDPWAMTGHCIHPFECERWRVGCGQCPNLKSDLPLRKDTTHALFNYKRESYRKAKFDLIVASRWMRQMVEASPLFEGVRIHEVPFGLDLNFFAPGNAVDVRQHFNIPNNALVISFRADSNQFKGLPYIIEALKQVKARTPIYLLSVGQPGLLESLADKFHIVEYPWVDELLIRNMFIASDIFLMPSVAEAFGMMAVEAMACGKPIIVFEGTALPDVTFCPDVGIAVPKRDANALAQAIQHLIDNPQEREQRGRKGRMLAEQHYDQDQHVKRMADIYHMVAQRQ